MKVLHFWIERGNQIEFLLPTDIRKCSKNEFQCRNGQCIDATERCIKSGIHQSGCADGSHLLNCRKLIS